MTNTNPNKVNPDQWNTGAPPFASWWLTTTPGTQPAWRWYEPAWGWSTSVSETASAQEAGALAMHVAHTTMQSQFLWSHYWPAGARVPRMMPYAMYTTPAPDVVLDITQPTPRIRLLG